MSCLRRNGLCFSKQLLSLKTAKGYHIILKHNKQVHFIR